MKATELVIAKSVDLGTCQEDVNFIASTIQKAEEKLISDGYTKITDRWDDEGYQTWFKQTEATFFIDETKTTVSVVKYNNFIG